MSEKQDKKQSIDELKKRYDTLNEKKIAAQTNLKSAQERLDELKKEAREKYSTDDLEELKKKLNDMKDENERKRAEYQTSLDKIEQELSKVESKYNELGSDAEDF